MAVDKMANGAATFRRKLYFGIAALVVILFMFIYVLPLATFVGLIPFLFNDLGEELPLWAYLFLLIPLSVLVVSVFITVKAVKIFRNFGVKGDK